MDRSPEAYMHVGIVHFMLFPDLQTGEGPAVQTAEALAADGFFHALEITRINDVSQRHAMRRLAESAHLTLGYGAHPQILSGGLDLSSADPELRSQSVTVVKSAIDEAAELGISMLTLLDGPGSAPTEPETDPAITRITDSLTELCDYASTHDLWIALEQFDRAIEKNSLLGPIDLCVKVSEMVRASTPNFGLCLDLSHLPLLGEDPPTSLRAAGDHLIQAHIGNCIMGDQEHPQYGALHPLQESFHEEHGLQCGFCTPGMIMRATEFLEKNPNPSEEEIRWGISGNLCRCTGYVNIVKAIQNAAEKMQKEVA